MNDSPTPRNSRPRRLRRFVLIALGIVALISVAGFIALPSVLNTAMGNRLVARRLNAAFAPGRLQFDTIRFSWFTSTRLVNVSLFDPADKRVLTAPSATLSPTFWGFIRHPNLLGTLDLHQASFDVAREAGGGLDIAEALQGIFSSPDPRRDLTIRAGDAGLTLHLPGVKQPLTVDRMNLDVRIRPRPLLLAWSVQLQKGSTGRLRLSGEFDRWRGNSADKDHPDLSVDAIAQVWPLQFDVLKAGLKGELDAAFRVDRKSGNWTSLGTANLPQLLVMLADRPNDPISLEKLTAAWDVKQEAQTWTFDRLNLRSPLGWLESTTSLPPDPRHATKISGELDLAAVARTFGKPLGLRDGLVVDTGVAKLSIANKTKGNGTDWTIDANVANLTAHLNGKALALRDPATISTALSSTERGVKLDHLDVKTSFLDVSGSGDLDQGINVKGAVDLARLKSQLVDWFELQSFDVAGQGVWNASYKRTGEEFAAESRLTVKDFKLQGVTSTSLAADQAIFNLRGAGKADGSGLPLSLAKGSLVLDAGNLNARAEIRPEPSFTVVSAEAHAPTRLFDHPAQFDFGFHGQFDESSRRLDIKSVALAARSTEPDAKLAPWAISAKGLFDLRAGTLTLSRSHAQATGRAFELDDGGIKVAGLDHLTTDLRINAACLGDVKALETQLAAWSGRPSLDLRGTWKAGLQVEPTPDGFGFQTTVNVNDLSWVSPSGARRTAESRVGLTSRGDISSQEQRVDFTEVVMSLPYLKVKGHGSVGDITGAAKLDFRGEIAPDWQGASQWMAEKFEPHSKVSGNVSPFHVKGSLRGAKDDEPIEAQLALEVTSADLFGMQLGATPIHVHTRGEHIDIAAIDTTLNGGKLHLEPSLEESEKGGMSLVLDDGSNLIDAAINDEVSHRVLSYVAPVLDQATRATGRVSVELKRAEFPLTSELSKKANVTGSVVFQDVEFAPGPLADIVIGVLGVKEPSVLRLDQPVLLSIADGRIHQRGLAIPLGKVARIEMEGWVDFDKNINLFASIPFNPDIMGNNRFLSGIVAGTKIKVPITGTLNNPKIDRAAMGEAMKDMGKNLLDRAVVPGVFDLLGELAKPRPRDPNAPPPPPRMTPRERQAERIEKRNERRRARGLPPLPMPDQP